MSVVNTLLLQNNNEKQPTTTTTTTTTTRTKTKKQNRVDFLRELPIELSIYILLHVGDEPKTLVRCRLVSKFWRKCAEDPILWREIFLARPNWKVKHLYPTTTTTNSNSIIDEQDQLSLIPTFSRQNSIQSYRSNGSANKHIARRLSQLLLSSGNEPNNNNHTTNTTQIIPSNNQIKQEFNLLDTECLINLDWIKLYRDRFILDSRWKEGIQITRNLKGHKDSIYTLQIHGNQIITGSRDRTIKIWDMKTGICQNNLMGHEGSVLCVRWEGRTILSGSSDCQVFIWQQQQQSTTTKQDSEEEGKIWKIEHKLIGHQSGVLDLGMNENVIVSCSKDTTVKLWNRFDGSLIRTITGHTGPVNAIELTQNPIPLNDLIQTQTNTNKNMTTTKGILTASGDSTMKLWSIKTGELIKTYQGHIRGIACLKFLEDKNCIITGSNDETIKFWNFLNGYCFRTLLGHEGLVRSLDVDLRQNCLVTGSHDRTVKVWDLETGQVKLDFRKGERKLVFDVKVHLTSIVLVGYDSSIMVLDFSHGLDCDNFL